MASIVLAFAAQSFAGAFENLYLNVRLGASYRPLVLGGQLDRLITANWLHGHYIHLLVNGIALWFLGVAVERLLGPTRFFIIYMVSCLGGAIASVLLGPGMPSVGASTGLLGLFAALGYIFFRFRSILPGPMRGGARQWVILILLNVALWVGIELFMPVVRIDHAGHAGGFVAGGIATILLARGWPPMVRSEPRKRRLAPLAWALGVVAVAGLAVSAQRYFSDDRSADLQVAQDALAGADTPPELLNAYAWFAAIDAAADEPLLRAALAMAERATAAEPDAAEMRDTLATAHYRLGELDRAVEIERAILEQTQESIYASQLARFLRARKERDGPWHIPEGSPHGLTLEFVRENGRAFLRPSMEGTVGDGMVFYALVGDGAGILGLVRGSLGPNREPPVQHPSTAGWPQSARVEVVLTDTTVKLPRGITFKIAEFTMDPTVATYP